MRVKIKDNVIPKGKICEGCHEFEATHKITYGKNLDDLSLVSVAFLCEMCLVDYEFRLKNIDIPYKIEMNPEKVEFFS